MTILFVLINVEIGEILTILTEQVEEVFHPVRFEMLKILKEKGPLSAEDLQIELKKQGIDLTKQEISMHISVLLSHKLIAANWKSEKDIAVRTFTISEGLDKTLKKAREMLEELEK